jgi:hypothetical protein
VRSFNESVAPSSVRSTVLQEGREAAAVAKPRAGENPSGLLAHGFALGIGAR